MHKLIGTITAAAMLLTAGAAYADPTEYLPGGAYVVSLNSAPAGPAITVHLSNGAVDVIRPCRYEDGRRCYWLSSEMGNGSGRSFIVTRGRVHQVDSRELAAVVR